MKDLIDLLRPWRLVRAHSQFERDWQTVGDGMADIAEYQRRGDLDAAIRVQGIVSEVKAALRKQCAEYDQLQRLIEQEAPELLPLLPPFEGLEDPYTPRERADMVSQILAKLLGKPIKTKRAGRNEARDRFAYEKRLKGLELKQIMSAVNKRKGWQPFRSESAVNEAIKRYCKRHKQALPRST